MPRAGRCICAHNGRLLSTPHGVSSIGRDGGLIDTPKKTSRGARCGWAAAGGTRSMRSGQTWALDGGRGQIYLDLPKVQDFRIYPLTPPRPLVQRSRVHGPNACDPVARGERHGKKPAQPWAPPKAPFQQPTESYTLCGRGVFSFFPISFFLSLKREPSRFCKC